MPIQTPTFKQHCRDWRRDVGSEAVSPRELTRRPLRRLHRIARTKQGEGVGERRPFPVSEIVRQYPKGFFSYVQYQKPSWLGMDSKTREPSLSSLLHRPRPGPALRAEHVRTQN